MGSSIVVIKSILLPSGKTERFHSAYISDEDINSFLDQFKDNEEDNLLLFEKKSNANNQDGLFEKAVDYMSNKETVSTSDLQGVLTVGHAKGTRNRRYPQHQRGESRAHYNSIPRPIALKI